MDSFQNAHTIFSSVTKESSGQTHRINKAESSSLTHLRILLPTVQPYVLNDQGKGWQELNGIYII